MDAKDEINKTLLTEPLKILIKGIISSTPFIIAFLPQVRNYLAENISFLQLLIILVVCASGLVISGIYIYYLRNKNLSLLTKITELNLQIPQVPDSGNKLYDFRAIDGSGFKAIFEVWYIHNGLFSDVSIVARLVRYDGNYLSGIDNQSGGEVIIHNISAVARIEFEYQPENDDTSELSAQVELCMEDINKGRFYCKRFPYERDWSSPVIKREYRWIKSEGGSKRR